MRNSKGRSYSGPPSSCLTQELLPGEKLLWSSPPGPVHRTWVDWSNLLFAAFLMVISVTVLVLVAKGIARGKDPSKIFMPIIIFTAAFFVGFLSLWSYLVRDPAERRQMIYGVTPQRLLILYRNDKALYVNSIPLSNLSGVSLQNTGHGRGTIELKWDNVLPSKKGQLNFDFSDDTGCFSTCPGQSQ